VQLPKYAFHLAEEANWPSIERHGLLPARMLLAQAYPANSTVHLQQRPVHVVLPTGVHIRDQRPMPARALASCLIGMGPHQWYDLINAHVFFWLDSSRVNRQRAACRSRPQVVAVVRTADLLARHAEIAYVTPFNVGHALRKPALRSKATLVPYNTWVTSGWAIEAEVTGRNPRPSSHPPAELLIRGPIPHFARLVKYLVKHQPVGDWPGQRIDGF
jgi:hypothetical protein